MELKRQEGKKIVNGGGSLNRTFYGIETGWPRPQKRRHYVLIVPFMELKQRGKDMYSRSTSRVLIVPFMELKRKYIYVTNSEYWAVLIVPFMELKH